MSVCIIVRFAAHATITEKARHPSRGSPPSSSDRRSRSARRHRGSCGQRRGDVEAARQPAIRLVLIQNVVSKKHCELLHVRRMSMRRSVILKGFESTACTTAAGYHIDGNILRGPRGDKTDAQCVRRFVCWLRRCDVEDGAALCRRICVLQLLMSAGDIKFIGKLRLCPRKVKAR